MVPNHARYQLRYTRLYRLLRIRYWGPPPRSGSRASGSLTLYFSVGFADTMLHSPFHSRCAACAISVRRQRLSSRIFADPRMSAVCVGHRRRVTSADGDWLRWRDLNPRHSGYGPDELPLLYTAILFYTGPVFVVPRPARGRLVPRFDCLGLRIPMPAIPSWTYLYSLPYRYPV